MWNKLFERQIANAERSMGVSLDYMRYVAENSTAAAWRFVRFSRLAQFRSHLPPTVMAVAAITSSMTDDCESCAQIAVNLARKRGVAADILNHVIHRQPERLPADLRDVYHFAEAVTSARDAGDLRDRLRRRYGDRGLIDLAMAIAMQRVYPTFKRALGYAQSCSAISSAAAPE